MNIIGPYICESCGHAGHPRSKTPGNFLIEIILWCLLIVPGLLYTIWRNSNKRRVCPSCAGHMILCDSPRGLKLVQDLHPEATGIKTPGWFA